MAGCSVEPLRAGRTDGGGDDYVFPVGRALRLVRIGRHRFRRHEGNEQLQELLERCQVHGEEAATAVRFPGLCLDSGEHTQPLLLLADVPCEATPSPLGWSEAERDALDRLERSQLEEARRFTTYHCHHVKVRFKQRRSLWTARMRGRTATPKGPPSPPPRELLTRKEASEVVSCLFQGSVLLHLTALFGVGERYLESLLELCLSCSIFLSQQHNHWRYAQAAGRWWQEPGPPLAVGGPTVSEEHPRQTHEGASSLHWAIAHYCEGVRLWGLMDHSGLLFPALRSKERRSGSSRTEEPVGLDTRVFTKLLQAHAGLLLSQLPTSNDTLLLLLPAYNAVRRPDRRPYISSSSSSPRANAETARTARRDAQHYLQSLLGGAASQRQSGAVEHWFGSDAQGSVLFTQQRCLQLLPMLWLSMLVNHIQRTITTGTTPTSEEGVGEGDGHANGLSLRAARHAFLRVVPLFAADAGTERTFWITVAVLYPAAPAPRTATADSGVRGGASSPASAVASDVEVAALLSTIERTCRSSSEREEMGQRLLRWLSSWREERRAFTGTSGLLPWRPRIHSARQLYSAFQSIPLTCCSRHFMASSVSVLRHPAPSSSASVSMADRDVASALFPGGTPRRGASTGAGAALSPMEPRQRRQPKEKAEEENEGEEEEEEGGPEGRCPAVDGLRFANELLFCPLLQWRSAQLPSFIPVAPLLAEAEAGEEEGSLLSPRRRHLLSYTSYLEELTMLLSAMVHLRELHRAASSFPRHQATATKRRRTALGDEADLAKAVELSVEAATRALAEQMGEGILPARLHGLAWSRRRARKRQGNHEEGEEATVTAVERQLLTAVHATTTEILAGRPMPLAESVEGAPAMWGRIPGSYLRALQQLLGEAVDAATPR